MLDPGKKPLAFKLARQDSSLDVQQISWEASSRRQGNDATGIV